MLIACWDLLLAAIKIMVLALPECDIIELRSTLMWDWFKGLLFVKCILQGCTSSAKDKTKRLHVQVSFFPDLFVVASITNGSWLVCHGIKQFKPTYYAGKSLCVLLNVGWLFGWYLVPLTLQHALIHCGSFCQSFQPSVFHSYPAVGEAAVNVKCDCRMCGKFFPLQILRKWWLICMWMWPIDSNHVHFAGYVPIHSKWVP